MTLLLAIAVAGCSGAAPTPRTVYVTATPNPAGVLLQLSGSGQQQTQTFEAPETWALDYSYDCGGAAVSQILVTAIRPQGSEQLLGNGGQRKAAGTTYGHGAGPTWIDVAISCSWAIVVRAG